MLLGSGLPRQGLADHGERIVEGGNIFSSASAATAFNCMLPWAVGFFSTNPELSMELWTVIAGISGFDD